jgi:hypothetical protein
VGQLIRSAALLAAAALVLVLRQRFVIDDALAVPLVVLFLGGFVVSVLGAARRSSRGARLSESSPRFER